MTEEIKQDEPLPFEPVRHYTAVSASFKLDWNMLLYSVEEEDGYMLDWNKLIYNEEQMAEFVKQKQERVVQPNFMEYMTKPANERTAMERFFLQQAGFACGDEEEDETNAEYDKLVKNRT